MKTDTIEILRSPAREENRRAKGLREQLAPDWQLEQGFRSCDKDSRLKSTRKLATCQRVCFASNRGAGLFVHGVEASLIDRFRRAEKQEGEDGGGGRGKK